MRIDQSWKLSTSQKLKGCRRRGGGAQHLPTSRPVTPSVQCDLKGNCSYFQPGIISLFIEYSLLGALPSPIHSHKTHMLEQSTAPQPYSCSIKESASICKMPFAWTTCYSTHRTSAKTTDNLDPHNFALITDFCGFLNLDYNQICSICMSGRQVEVYRFPLLIWKIWHNANTETRFM